MSGTITPAQARDALSDFTGTLISPEDAGYDDARAVYNAMIDRRPALIARPRGREDIARAIGFARERDLLLAVRGGGHNGAGLGTCDGGVVIDLSRAEGHPRRPGRADRAGRRRLHLARGRRTRRHEYGLATPSGIIGVDRRRRPDPRRRPRPPDAQVGLTIDNLLEAEVVLADGRHVRASADEHPDLFWALRGGGGNFGVVTEFTFRLHEVGHDLRRPDVLADRAVRRGPARVPRVHAPGAA